jgi:sirohydrochlorin cobaltochelatase
MLGVIVFAHGSRDPLWRAPIEAIAGQIAEQDAQVGVACAYLELCEPNLDTACQTLIAKGVTQVRILPLFFGMGKHAREDLPELVHALQAAHPNVVFERLPPAGEDPRMTALLAQIALESVK